MSLTTIFQALHSRVYKPPNKYTGHFKQCRLKCVPNDVFCVATCLREGHYACLVIVNGSF